MNRRDFLKAGAAGFAASMLGGYAAYAAEQKTYRVGLIGTGWYGKSDLFRLMQVSPVEVVSICDVDKKLLAEAQEMIGARQKNRKPPRAYGDYRQMLKERDLDIVIVGTPDHWHALNTIDAIQAGAHVYCQKPTSVDVLEGEAMLAAARKHKRVVQVGMQRRSTPHLAEAKKNIIEAGLLGKIAHVEICCYYHMRANGNPPVTAVPNHLDYELWTGPAPLRPYDGLPHIRWWRTFMEYGNGIVGDMCVHMLDAVRWMMGLGWPKRISSTGGILVQKEGKSNISDTQTATFEYDGLNVVWQHRTWGAPPDPAYPWAMFFYGDKGTLKASVQQYEFIPQGKGEKIQQKALVEGDKYPEDLSENRGEPHAFPATRRQMLDFLACIESGARPVADIEEGHISAASCILANVAMDLGRPLVYNPATRQVIGDAQATALLRRPYRGPWRHPAEAL